MHTHASWGILSPAKRMMITIAPPSRVSVQAGVAESSEAHRECVLKEQSCPLQQDTSWELPPPLVLIVFFPGGCLVTHADSDTRPWVPGSYSITSLCSENVGPDDSQPPAEDRQAASALPSLGCRSGNSDSACDAQVLQRLQGAGKEATKHPLSYVHSPRPTPPP